MLYDKTKPRNLLEIKKFFNWTLSAYGLLIIGLILIAGGTVVGLFAPRVSGGLRAQAESAPEPTPTPAPEPTPIQHASTEQKQALTTTEIVQLAKPAVVLIEGLNSQTGKEQLGTGFFVDPVTIVTNDHVMRGTYDNLAVHKFDGTYFTIDYIAFTSQEHDICVLRTKEQSSNWLDLSASLPLEGEPIVVIGNPKGLTGTISQGIVSALRGNGVMQITAPVTHGSSGSPVLNMDGHVVAVVDRVADQDEANLGFSRDLRVLKLDVAFSKNNRYGDAFSLTQSPVSELDQFLSNPKVQQLIWTPVKPVTEGGLGEFFAISHALKQQFEELNYCGDRQKFKELLLMSRATIERYILVARQPDIAAELQKYGIDPDGTGKLRVWQELADAIGLK